MYNVVYVLDLRDVTSRKSSYDEETIFNNRTFLPFLQTRSITRFNIFNIFNILGELFEDRKLWTKIYRATWYVVPGIIISSP